MRPKDAENCTDLRQHSCSLILSSFDDFPQPHSTVKAASYDTAPSSLERFADRRFSRPEVTSAAFSTPKTISHKQRTFPLHNQTDIGQRKAITVHTVEESGDCGLHATSSQTLIIATLRATMGYEPYTQYCKTYSDTNGTHINLKLPNF